MIYDIVQYLPASLSQYHTILLFIWIIICWDNQFLHCSQSSPPQHGAEVAHGPGHGERVRRGYCLRAARVPAQLLGVVAGGEREEGRQVVIILLSPHHWRKRLNVVFVEFHQWPRVTTAKLIIMYVT